MATVMLVVGARPNFVKMAPVANALADQRPDIGRIIVHTGQHYDRRLSQEVLDDLGFPSPELFLEVGSGLHGQQTARVIERMESVLIERRPDAIVVAGDVNSTLGCALAAAKLLVPVVHVESGLRSFDWSMPEEINRVLTDRLSSLLLTHSPEAETNLSQEGIDRSRIVNVGNTMIDSLRRFEAKARARAVWRRLGAAEREYVLVTLHRPSNVECPERLQGIVTALVALNDRSPVIFPAHPRTQARLHRLGLLEQLTAGSVALLAPLGYLDFLSLEAAAGAILTDSGGVQEEASALGIPCYTLRPNTERPVTLSHGTNVLLGDDPARIADIRINGVPPRHRPIPMWDGRAGERAAHAIARFIDSLPTESEHA